MISQCPVDRRISSISHFLEQTNFSQMQTSDLPILLSTAPNLTFKVSKNQGKNSQVVAEVFLQNQSYLQIKELYRTLFITEMTAICNTNLSKINLEILNFQTRCQEQNKKLRYLHENNGGFFHYQLTICEKNLQVSFFQKPQTMEYITVCTNQTLKMFIIFLEFISQQLIKLIQKMGLKSNNSFLEKLRSNMLIRHQKRLLKTVLKERKHGQDSNATQIEAESGQNQDGVFKKIEIIKQEANQFNQCNEKRGGYFIISQKKFEIKCKDTENDSTAIKNLAQKKLSKRKRLGTQFKYEEKASRELSLLKRLNNLTPLEQSYFAQYYMVDQESIRRLQKTVMIEQKEDQSTKYSSSVISQEQDVQKILQNTIYMDYYDHNLQEYIQKNGRLDIRETINVLKQIFQTVQLLHKNGIVHRDIKPANFMIGQSKDGRIKTKLIDFGESTHVNMNYSQNQILGFSPHYAPLECTYNCKQGFNAKEIDLWSVGVVIYKLIKNRLPVSFFKSFSKHINTCWPSQLQFFITQYGRGKWSILENMLVLMSVLFMKVKPKDRLNLKLGLKILNRIEQLINKFLQQN